MVLLKVSERLRRAVWTNVFSLVDALALLVSEFPHLKVLSNVFILEILALQGSEGRQREVLTHVFILGGPSVSGSSSAAVDQCVLSRGRSRSAGVGVPASQCTVQRVHSRDPRPAGVGGPATRGADPRVHSRGPSVSGSSSAAVDGSGARVFSRGRPGSPAGQVPGFPSRSGDVPPWKRARHFPSLREGEPCVAAVSWSAKHSRTLRATPSAGLWGSPLQATAV